MKKSPRRADIRPRVEGYTHHASGREGWGDHPKGFIALLRGYPEEYVEFSFEPSPKEELRRILSRGRKINKPIADADMAKKAFIGDLEWALTCFLAAQIETTRPGDGVDEDLQLLKKLHRCLGAVLGPLREMISPDRRYIPQLFRPNGPGFLPPEFVIETFQRMESLYIGYGRCIELVTEVKGRNPRGGRPREWLRRDFIERAAKAYRTNFGDWPASTRDGPFLSVLDIALKAVGFHVQDLYPEVRKILQELKGSTSP